MEQKETEAQKTEAVDHTEKAPANALKDRKTILTAKRVETIVAILLGVTTLLSAWASWISHLHGGLQSINFTKSNNESAHGTTASNIGMQAYLADYMTWNTLREYKYDLKEAEADGDQAKAKIIREKIETYKKQNIDGGILAEAIKWMEENNEDDPFKMPGMAEKYVEEGSTEFEKSQELLEEGKRDNTKGDSYMLVTVIYSLTLFLLGIVNTFKNMANRKAVLFIAVGFLVFTFIYMCTIPLPTGFDKMNFFKFNS